MHRVGEAKRKFRSSFGKTTDDMSFSCYIRLANLNAGFTPVQGRGILLLGLTLPGRRDAAC